MTPNELADLRIRVAEAMGWTNVRYPTATELGDLIGCPPGFPSIAGPVPYFGSPDWSATGAVLDEIKRRGWQWIASCFPTCIIRTSQEPEPDSDANDIEAGRESEGIDCEHLAVCRAFLAACEKDKETP